MGKTLNVINEPTTALAVPGIDCAVAARSAKRVRKLPLAPGAVRLA